MPSTIVCGVDGSDAARAVADTADWLARGLDAQLVVLHVTEDSRREGEELLASIRATLTVAGSEVREVDGDPVDRLLAAVDQEGVEQLVVGSRGRGSIRSAVFGSVS